MVKPASQGGLDYRQILHVRFVNRRSAWSCGGIEIAGWPRPPTDRSSSPWGRHQHLPAAQGRSTARLAIAAANSSPCRAVRLRKSTALRLFRGARLTDPRRHFLARDEAGAAAAGSKSASCSEPTLMPWATSPARGPAAGARRVAPTRRKARGAGAGRSARPVPSRLSARAFPAAEDARFDRARARHRSAFAADGEPFAALDEVTRFSSMTTSSRCARGTAHRRVRYTSVFESVYCRAESCDDARAGPHLRDPGSRAVSRDESFGTPPIRRAIAGPSRSAGTGDGATGRGRQAVTVRRFAPDARAP